MKRFFCNLPCFVLMVAMSLFCVLSVDVYAAEDVPYTLGTEITQERASTTENYTFEITKRTVVKVYMNVLEDETGQTNKKMSFYFARQNSGDEEGYDYEEKHTVEPGQELEIEVTLQPGAYEFVASRLLGMSAYKIKIDVVEEISAPVHTGVTEMSVTKLNVAYTIGSEFKVHNYQYDHDKIYYSFKVPYRTQYDLSISIVRNPYQYIGSSSTYEDEITIIKNDEYATMNPKYFNMERDGKSIRTLFVNSGESAKATVTLEAGEYYVVQDRDSTRSDFTFKMSQGTLMATSVKLSKSTYTVERGDITAMGVTTLPEKGTANVKFKSSNTKVAKVSATGIITGVEMGTAKITAYLPNGKSTTCKVKVVELKAVAEVVKQKGFYCYHNEINVLLDHTPQGNYFYSTYIGDLDIFEVARTYKIYRSTKKKGKYKYIGKTVVTKSLGYAEYVDKKVKPNKRYYYKVKMKIDGETGYGPMSKAVAYWTAPKPKVKIISNTYSTIKWKKVKNTTGYILTESYISFAGYNIFGQKLADSVKDHRLIKGTTTAKRKYYSTSSSGSKTPSEISLTTYGKHGKYYYVSGRIVSKNKSDFQTWEAYRFAY